MKSYNRTNILGVGVSALNMQMAIQQIREWIDQKDPHYICVTGVHGVMESQKDAALQHIHNQAGLVVPDGMPLVWISYLKGHKQIRRVYGPDLLLAACETSRTTHWKHYFYGGAPGVAELLAQRLSARFPGLIVAGWDTPPFRPLTPEEDQIAIQKINAAAPDIVWVGLSTPKQERWMAGHVGRVAVPVMAGVGAAFDFHAGLKKQAPRWMQNIGMEWLFRLATEPKRLWRRYLINNPKFVILVIRQWLGLKKYRLE